MLFAYIALGETYVDQSGTSDIVTMRLGPELVHDSLAVILSISDVGEPTLCS